MVYAFAPDISPPSAWVAAERVNRAAKLRRVPDAVAVALAILHWVLAVTAATHLSPTFDEPAHLTAGYSYWLRNDYRLNPENGNLPQRWAALPLLFEHPRFIAPDAQSWLEASEGNTGREFFYKLGNDSDRMVMRGRMMIALLSGALCLVVYFWSKEIFGRVGALISVTLCAFSPTMLGHGAFVTSDTAASLFFIAAVWSAWRMLQRVTVARVLTTAALFGALAAAKLSAPIAVPIVFGMAIVGVISTSSRLRQSATIGAAFLFIAGTTLLSIWAAFGFRYSLLAQEDAYRIALDAKWNRLALHHGMLMDGVNFARAHHLLPEAYLLGLGVVDRDSHGRPAFLDGECSLIGFVSFFPKAFLYKSTIPELAFVVFGMAAVIWRWRKFERDAPSLLWSRVGDHLYRITPLLLLIGVYGAFALATSLNIAHRHILPIYPALFVLCGAVGSLLKTRNRRAFAAITGVLLTWHVAQSCAVRPEYVSYFNEIAGGPRNGYKHLVDGSLDWGQDLPALRQWLDEHQSLAGNRPLYLAYFGAADPQHYGIHALALPEAGPSIAPLGAGLYCVSATNLQQVYSSEMGAWCKLYEDEYQHALAALRDDKVADPQVRSACAEEFRRLAFGRLCAFLRHRPPTGRAGHSIFIYDLSDADLAKALFGPPAELFPAPLVEGVE